MIIDYERWEEAENEDEFIHEFLKKHKNQKIDQHKEIKPTGSR